MRLSVLLPASLIALLSLGLAADNEAQADGYVGIGLGSDSQISGDLANHFTTSEDTSSSRIILGQRFGALALEASLFGSQLQGMSGLSDNESFSTISLGVDLKYNVGLFGALEGYGKIGLNKTWLTGPETSQNLSYEGRGEAMGLGLEYSFNIAVTRIGLWADYTLQHTELRDGNREALDGELGMFNLGISVGL